LAFLGVKQLEPVDDEVVMLREGDGGPPAIPAGVCLASIKGGSEEADDNQFSSSHSEPPNALNDNKEAACAVLKNPSAAASDPNNAFLKGVTPLTTT